MCTSIKIKVSGALSYSLASFFYVRCPCVQPFVKVWTRASVPYRVGATVRLPFMLILPYLTFSCTSPKPILYIFIRRQSESEKYTKVEQ